MVLLKQGVLYNDGGTGTKESGTSGVSGTRTRHTAMRPEPSRLKSYSIKLNVYSVKVKQETDRRELLLLFISSITKGLSLL